MKILTFPNYVTLGSAMFYSPQFWELLKTNKVILEQIDWDGTLEDIPDNEPVIIRASTQMLCETDELTELASECGHLVFHDDELVTEDGYEDTDLLIEAGLEFLENAKLT